MQITALSDLADPARCPRLVVKVGSAWLVDAAGPRRAWIAALVSELAAARARGQDVIVVSSGAIALGARTLGLDKGGRGSLADAQAAAAVGQIALSGLWAELLAQHGLTAAQLLLTLDDLEDRRRYLNATATLSRLRGGEARTTLLLARFESRQKLRSRHTVQQCLGATGVGCAEGELGHPGFHIV